MVMGVVVPITQKMLSKYGYGYAALCYNVMQVCSVVDSRRTYTYIYMYIYKYIYTHIHMYMYVYTSTYTYIHTGICT